MTQSQIINVIVSSNRQLVFEPHKKYQMLIDAFGNIRFLNQDTGNYLPDGFMEVG